MALTKSTAEVDAWAEIAQAGFREGANTDVSDSYGATLHIDCAIAEEAVAHTGTEVIVQIGTDTSDADDKWSTLVRWIGPTGTAVGAAFANQEAAAQTVLGITDPATHNVDNHKKFKFINAATEANSEIVYSLSDSGDGGDTVTIQDGLTNQQEATSVLLDFDTVATEVVAQWNVAIPLTADRIRVLYNNNYDADGAKAMTRCRISKVTAL